MSSYHSYVLCTSPRSGSTLLCKLLAATGMAGKPGSHFHKPSIASWLEEYGLERSKGEREGACLARIFEAAIEKGRGSTGIFGLRLQRHSFDFFQDKLAVLYPGTGSQNGRLEKAFGKTLFLYLSRSDKIAQSVSYVMAQQSGLWHRHADGRELERLKAAEDPLYDFERLRECRRTFVDYDIAWEQWFAQENIQPLRLSYEALSVDPLGTLAQVLAALGLDPQMCQATSVPTARLADQRNAEWIDRFKQDLIDKGNC